MDFNDTPKQAEFRAKCRDWLDANANIKDESKPKSISSAAENDLETINSIKDFTSALLMPFNFPVIIKVLLFKIPFFSEF